MKLWKATIVVTTFLLFSLSTFAMSEQSPSKSPSSSVKAYEYSIDSNPNCGEDNLVDPSDSPELQEIKKKYVTEGLRNRMCGKIITNNFDYAKLAARKGKKTCKGEPENTCFDLHEIFNYVRCEDKPNLLQLTLLRKALSTTALGMIRILAHSWQDPARLSALLHKKYKYHNREDKEPQSFLELIEESGSRIKAKFKKSVVPFLEKRIKQYSEDGSGIHSSENNWGQCQ